MSTTTNHISPAPASQQPWKQEGWLNADGKCWVGEPESNYPLGETGDFDEYPHEWKLVHPPKYISSDKPIFILPHWYLPLPAPSPLCSFLDQIEELAREMKLSKAEVLRQSIGLYAQVLAQAKQGKIIQFKDEEVAEEVEIIPSSNANFISQSRMVKPCLP